MQSIPLVAIVGAPNVGKSTLFNRLVRKRKALVTDEPGVTRDRIYGVVGDAPRPFRLVDTGGLTPLSPDLPFAKAILEQAGAALDEASLALFVVDTRVGPTVNDREVLTMLRRRGTPILVVANKVETVAQEAAALEVAALGAGEPVLVSAEHGEGIGDLLGRIAERLPAPSAVDREPEAEPELRIAIVGRPNVGKSSIVNRLLGGDRVLVSATPGTTRDAVDAGLAYAGRALVLVDTAGLRRKGRIRETVEFLSVGRARAALESAHVAVLVLDATTGITAQDLHVAGYASEAAKPIVIAVNKWDLAEEREDAAKRWEARVRAELDFLKGAPVVFVSAKSGQRVSRLLDEVVRLDDLTRKRVPTPELNRWLGRESTRERSAPAGAHSVRLFYATQTGVRPLRFVLFCNDARRIHVSLRRRLENSLREAFGFESAPIRITFRSRREPQERP